METKRDSYYDFDVEIEEVLIKNGMIADMFYLKDLKQRKLFLNDEINSLTVEDAVKHIMQINREDAGSPMRRERLSWFMSTPMADLLMQDSS